MKHRFLIANWKSNKSLHETKSWFRDVHAALRQTASDWSKITMVVCVPFPLLAVAAQCIVDHNLPIELGAQDVSRFPQGPYTGEVSAALIADFARFVIIGHTERRAYLKELDDVLSQKVDRAGEFSLHTVYCVNSQGHEVPPGAEIVSYEPDFAIGTGKAEDPSEVNGIASVIKHHTGGKPVLYGGSVTTDNIGYFMSQTAIDGVLVGTASLEPQEFADMARTMIETNPSL